MLSLGGIWDNFSVFFAFWENLPERIEFFLLLRFWRYSSKVNLGSRDWCEGLGFLSLAWAGKGWDLLHSLKCPFKYCLTWEPERWLGLSLYKMSVEFITWSLKMFSEVWDIKSTCGSASHWPRDPALQAFAEWPFFIFLRRQILQKWWTVSGDLVGSLFGWGDCFSQPSLLNW